MHQSILSTVAGVLRSRHLDVDSGEILRATYAVDINLLGYRYPDEQQIWVAISAERESFDLSLETATRLHESLGVLLKRFAA